MRVAILGGTKGMGRALARLMAERGDRICLLGRDAGELEKSAHDLTARGAALAIPARCDLEDVTTFAPALDEAARGLGGLDIVVVTAATFAPQADLEADVARLERLLTVDFTNTILFCESARARLLASAGAASPIADSHPTLCVFSSVAGERGRKPVIFYGAAKAGLTRYLEALDHKYFARGLRVVTVKPGFVKTSMTEGLPLPPFAGEAGAAAKTVLKAIDRGTPVVYVPPIWALVMMVIRWLPRRVMRKVEF
jgi:NAD(P)-dependent dehydrogenase (short-subunit alcohol dehydrogenase family)